MHRIDIKFDKLMWPATEASWVVLYEHTTLPFQDGGRPPSWILKSYRKSALDWDIGTKFCAVVEINSWKVGCMSERASGNKSRWRWPPSWISFLGHNLSANQHFCTKFRTVMENQQSKWYFVELVLFFENPTWRTAAIFNIKVIIIQSWIEICAQNFVCKVVEINSGKSAVC